MPDISSYLDTTASVAVGGTYSGDIEVSYDTDWIAVSLLADTTYVVDLQSDDLALSPLYDTYLNGIYDNTGAYIANTTNDDWNGLESQVTFTTTSAGAYYIDAGAFGSGTGTYTVSVNETTVAADDFGSSITDLNLGFIDPGFVATGSIETSYDNDWFSVWLDTGVVYDMSVSSTSGTGYPWLEVMDSSGYYVWEGVNYTYDPVTYEEVMSFTPTTAGEYFIQVSDYNTGDYALSLSAGATVAADDFGSWITDANLGAVTTDGTPASGAIETSYDNDWFAVTLDANATYDMSVSSTSGYPWIEIMDSNGWYVWEGIDYTWDPVTYEEGMSFTPTTGGTYYVQVTDYDTGDYQLSVNQSQAAVVDSASSYIDTNASMVVGGTYNGDIETSYDTDWVGVDLVQGTTYVVNLQAQDSALGTLGDTYINGIYDSNGYYISGTYNDDGGTGLESQVTFTATATDRYYIDAGAFGSGTGTYTLSVDAGGTVATDTIGSSIYDTNLGSITAGSLVDGAIETSYDYDWYEITLSADTVYDMSVSSATAYPWLEIMDSSGYYVWEGVNYTWDATTGDGISFTPTTGGTYYLQVSDWEVGDYQLSVSAGTAVAQDAVGSSTADHATITDNGVAVAGAIETSYDNDWYAIELTAGNVYDMSASSTTGYPWLEIMDSNGYYVWEGVNYTWDATTGADGISFTPSTTNTYYIQVTDYNVGDYQLTVNPGAAPAQDAVGSSTVDHGTITVDDIATSGSIETSYDNDWYAIDLAAGNVYDMSVLSTTGNYPWLDVMDSSGYYVWEGIDYTWDYTTGASGISFTPSTAGTYYVQVSDWEVGDYQLSVNSGQAVVDSASSYIDTSASMSVGGSYNGDIETSYDTDWVAVDLASNTTYVVDLQGQASTAGTLNDTYLNGVYDSDGYYISGTYNDDFNGLESQVTFTTSTAGIYYVSAGAFGSDTGTYTLSINTPQAVVDSEGSTTSTASTIAADGVAVAGTIDSSYDNDWYSITLDANMTYDMSVLSSTGNYPWLDVMDSNGYYVWEGVEYTWDYDTSASGISFTPTTAGTYYVQVTDWDVGEYTLEVSQNSAAAAAVASDVTASDTTTATINVGGNYAGEIELSYDTDWVAVNLSSNTTYVIDLQGQASGFGTLSDTYINGVFDDKGDYISNTSNDDFNGLESQVTFTTTASGTYYIDAGAYGSNTGTYRLSIDETTVATDAIADTIATTATVAADGVAVAGTIETNYDSDWFAITLDSNTTYDMSVSSAAGYPWLDVMDSSGNYVWEGVEYTWDYTTDTSGISFTPTTNGTYYVQVTDWTTGDYQLSVSEGISVAGDAVGSTTLTASVFDDLDTDADGVVAGTIETSYDNDWYEVTLAADTVYDMSASSTTGYPWLEIMDSDGYYVWEGVNYTWDPETYDNGMSFSTSTGGTYYVQVSDWNTGNYELSISENTAASADSVGSTTSTAGTIALDAPLEGNLETSYDDDWYQISVVAGTTYDITLNIAASDYGMYIDVLDSNGYYTWDNVYWDWDSTSDEKIVFTATETTDYFIQVSGWESGLYTLNVSENTSASADTVGSTAADAGIFADLDTDADDIVEGRLDTNYDNDWYEISVTAGTTYDIVLNSDDMTWPYLDILDSNGWYVWEGVYYDWDATADDKITFTASQDGDYYVQVSGWETGDYTLGVSENNAASADTVGSTLTDHSNVEIGVQVDGTIDTSYDSDWYHLDATAGTSYDVTLDIVGSNYGMYIDVLDSNGNYTWENLYWDWNSAADEKIVFTASETGDYYIQVSGWETGAYTLNVSEDTSASADTVGSTAADAGIFADLDTDTDGVITGTLDSNYDNDWYEISVTAGTTYDIVLNSDDMTWPYLDIMDSNGWYVWEGVYYDWSATDDDRISFTASQDGDYYVQVSGWETGDYTLEVSEDTTMTDDYESTTSTAGTLTLGQTETGTIEVSDDEDWFALDLEGGTTYQINLSTGSVGYNTLDTVIEGIYDSTGNYIVGTYNDDGGSGLNSQVIFDVVDTGTYYVSASAYANATGDYQISALEYRVNDANDVTENTSTTASVVVENSYVGEVDYSYDNDFIKVTLVADQAYNIDVSGLSLNDTYINGIYDSTGTLIADTSNDDAGWYTLDSHVDFTATESGNYFVSVGAYGAATGTYELEVSAQRAGEAVGEDVSTSDINYTTATAITGNTLGTYENGIIDYSGDEDLFAFTFEAGREYEIGLYGSDTDSGTLSDTYLNGIYDSDGNMIAGTSNDDGGIGLNSALTYTATESGTHYVSAGAYGSAIGTYELKVTANALVEDTDVQAASTSFTEGDGSWTIMVYLAADNNLEEMALDDINEMELGTLPDNVNVTFLIDRADGYTTAEGDWTDTRRGIIEQDDDAYSIGSTMESIGEQDTGDGQTLTDFINWSTEMASADNYGLVIWNHGGGIDGVAWDETSSNDNLEITELTQAIQASNVDSFEMLGFDACLQGVIDQTYDVKDVADIVVASEDLEPGDGWDYEGWFNQINEDSADGNTAVEVATAAVDSYGAFYEDHYMETTLSAIDTTQLDAVVTAFDDFNQSLSDINANQNFEIDREFNDVAKFGSYDEYVDIGSLATAIDGINITDNADSTGNTTDDYAATLITAIDTAVIANATTVDGATGISMYYPGYSDETYLDEFQVAEQTHMATLYDVLAS